MTSHAVVVSHKGRAKVFDAEGTTLGQLRAQIAREFGIEPGRQKLLHQGKLAVGDTALVSTLVAPGGKVLLMGTAAAELAPWQANVARRQEGRANYQKYKATAANVHRTPAGRDEFGFGALENLDIPYQAEAALQMLRRLAADEGVRQIMKQHRYAVGVLQELHPNERSILGYNRNRGEVIALRLRTDDLEGFRDYLAVRQVLMHELAHMVWDAHDDNFHRLNRQHCKEVIDLDWTLRGRTVGPRVERYQPDEAQDVDGGSLGPGGFVLGGPAPADDARELAYRAAMRRSGKQ
ncbi:hypothetical protein GGF46_003538 [Coemansia sp. RSA 552]|nr:hypothetical protein GGF46_003538 [Coemansia sp. RSA 552]